MSTAVLLMAACGGGADVDTSRAQGFVAQIAAAQPSAADARKRALAATEITVDAAAAFDWAEYTYPELFPKGPQNFTAPHEGVLYTVRSYANGNYLGVTPGNDIYGLGPFTNGDLKLLGNLSEFAAQIRADACSVHPGSCDADRANQLFDWAEYTYPALFPKGPPNADVVRDGVDYVERAYTNGNALRMTRGSADPTVYGFGPFTDDVLVSFGKWSDFAALVHADACNVYPGSCGGQTPTGTLNECTDPDVATLPTGFTSRLVYVYSGALTGELTGEQTIETVIDGPSQFEGQNGLENAIKITSVTSGTNIFDGEAVATSTKVESFEQLGSNGVTKTLGALVETTMSVDGISIPMLSSKTVYTPPRENLEFHIALGETGTIVSTSTTTTIVPPGSPIGSTVTDTFTFEEKVEVTVPAGKFETCQYRTNGENANSYTTAWHIVGKGIAAKIVATENGVTTLTQQLKSGSYNGAPL